MEWSRYVRDHLPALPVPAPREREIVAELAGQLEQVHRDALATGADEAEARRRAEAEITDWPALAHVLAAAEAPLGARVPPGVRDALDADRLRGHRGGRLLADLLQDLRYTLRGLRRNPGFTAAAVMALVLGIGANSAIFSVVHAVIDRALPFRNPGQLVWVANVLPRQHQNLVFDDIYSGWRLHNHVFRNLAAYSPGDAMSFTGAFMGATGMRGLLNGSRNGTTLTGAGDPVRVAAPRVTASFLPVLGVVPELGRNFDADEDRPGGPPAALLSDALWRGRFSASPKILGHSIDLNGRAYTVVGVLPPSFEFIDDAPADVLTPLGLPESSILRQGDRITVHVQLLGVVARLRPGVSTAAAAHELDLINRGLLSRLPHGLSRVMVTSRAQIVSLHDHWVGDARPAVLLLLLTVGFVLLIACADVANLQLARGIAREKEIAVRAALGAGRLRIARLVLLESVLVSLAGGGGGLLLATAVLGWLRRYGPANLPHLTDARLDPAVLVATLLVAVAVGVLCGLAPMIAAWRIPVNRHLQDGSPQAGVCGRRRRCQGLLVAAEMAAALMLLAGAGLLVRSFLRLGAVAPGFTAANVFTARIDLPPNLYATPDQQRAFCDRLMGAVQALPGVNAAGAANALPLSGTQAMTLIRIDGRTDSPATAAGVVKVTPGYFPALKLSATQGRVIEPRDGPQAANVAVVNQAFAESFFPGRDALGQKMSFGITTASGPLWTIVGVVPNFKQESLAHAATPLILISADQSPTATLDLAIRARLDAATLIPALRNVVTELDPHLPLDGVQTLDARLGLQLARQRFNALAVAGFAALALLLAAIGIYGVIVQAVGARYHELGVRLALGATPGNLVGMVLAQGVRLTLMGAALGLVAALVLTRSMSSLLYGITPDDPSTLIAAVVALLLVSLFACWLPARHASRIEPWKALHHE